MDVKRLITHFAYRIEPKPEGGFIARASDPSVPPLEAATREELQQKIQQNILSTLSAEFPGLKDSLENKTTEFAFHIEHKPGGGFAIHSSDPNTGVVEAATEHDLQSRFLEKILGVAGKALLPELSKAFAAQVGGGDIKVVVNRSTAVKFNTGSQKEAFGTPFTPSPTLAGSVKGPDGAASTSEASLGGSIDSSPITPESSSSWKIVIVLLMLLALGAFAYFRLR